MGDSLTIAGLFSGIGGLERGLHAAGHRSIYLCENWDPARRVLERHFDEATLDGDITAVTAIPEADVIVGGFPCSDLSQAGHMAGIGGAQSGLVMKALKLAKRHKRAWLILENVRNMLYLDGGAAMTAITDSLSADGYTWAYRLVDSRFTGVPQRRQRVILVASRIHDPRLVLFADEAGERPAHRYRQDAFGFYWTEGRGGVGWAVDAVPPLKNGSRLGIPSPPAVWLPGNDLQHRFVLPGIATGEQMQGFPKGWTHSDDPHRRHLGARWKMVGNAVTVGVAKWVGTRLSIAGEQICDQAHSLSNGDKWPHAAWGSKTGKFAVEASMWPTRVSAVHLSSLMRQDFAPLSYRAANGFRSRLEASGLRVPEQFRIDLKEYVEATRPD